MKDDQGQIPRPSGISEAAGVVLSLWHVYNEPGDYTP
jgi:hypothetical protein